MLRQIGGATHDDDVGARLELAECAGQLGRAGALVMAEGFAVGCDEESGAGRQRECGAGEAVGELGAVGETVSERDPARKLAVETEDRQVQISATPDKGPGFAASAAETPLVGTEDDELNACA